MLEGRTLGKARTAPATYGGWGVPWTVRPKRTALPQASHTVARRLGAPGGPQGGLASSPASPRVTRPGMR